MGFGSYVIIARTFLEGGLKPDEFEAVFLSVFRGEGDSFAPHETQALLDLFIAVDSYSANPDIRGESDLDEAGLVDAVRGFLAALPSLREREET